MSIALTSPEAAPLAELEHRASLYKLIALGFLFPREDLADLFSCDGPVARWSESGDGSASLYGERSRTITIKGNGCAMRRFAAFLTERRLMLDDLVSEYNRLFLGERSVPLIECEFLCRHEFEKAKNLADIMGFYRAFGVVPRQERADHLSSELEFMFWLLTKERHALERGEPDHLAVARDAQRKFMADHLGAWMPELFDSLKDHASCGERSRTTKESFYLRLAAVLKALLAKEQYRLEKV